MDTHQGEETFLMVDIIVDIMVDSYYVCSRVYIKFLSRSLDLEVGSSANSQKVAKNLIEGTSMT